MKNFSLFFATLRNRFKVEDVPFQFRNPGVLVDGDLRLRLHGTLQGDARRGIVPEYIFDMVRADSPDKPDHPATVMGRLTLRIGNTEHIEKYAGHIGYSVDPPYRGRRLAARSCLLILPLALAHGINPLWITCNPENAASRRTCEIIGSTLVETVPIPPSDPLYRWDTKWKCRYRVDL
ncbi:MAG: GNAT family N-acetyltransferase [Gemmatimonadetes bacterium]|nr:GNAT family N-acetyltransferase [Gemmatimonadota bacterium]MYD26199.1 GNAT family N-acetyltransferase [Gemmatimonadota bacterium]MYJ00246.1 GNAT family N-acetyltransferase [Gemmatimonadota bacterium]